MVGIRPQEGAQAWNRLSSFQSKTVVISKNLNLLAREPEGVNLAKYRPGRIGEQAAVRAEKNTLVHTVLGKAHMGFAFGKRGADVLRRMTEDLLHDIQKLWGVWLFNHKTTLPGPGTHRLHLPLRAGLSYSFDPQDSDNRCCRTRSMCRKRLDLRQNNGFLIL